MKDTLFCDILSEIKQRFMQIAPEQLEETLDAVKSAERVVLHGKGRMGMMLKAFGINLLQTGKDVRVVADVTAPHIGKGDLFIGASASGFPLASTRFFETARQQGSKVCAVTAYRKGPIGQLADMFIEIKARTMNLDVVDITSLQPMCTTLEQVELFALDYIAKCCGEKQNCTQQSMERYIDSVLEPIRGFDTDLCDAFIDAWELQALQGKKIYFAAQGRQQHILSAFAMRVYHMGFPAYVTHEVNCPAMQEADVLVSAVRDHTDRMTLLQTQLACEIGAKNVVIAGTQKDLSMPKDAKRFVLCPSNDDDIRYSQQLLVILDYSVRRLMQRHNWIESDLLQRHTNLE